MRRERNPGGPLEDRQIPVQVRLAAWWATLVFLHVYVDILGPYMPGVVEDILAGVVWALEIDQTSAFAALTLMAVPILMVALSMTLPARANRRANLASRRSTSSSRSRTASGSSRRTTSRWRSVSRRWRSP